ncbi:T9SS type A sorting domain-containing protein [Niastella caeni]|nr:T9SS type A sorting domain-containing protein [Niastella caeni]
MNPLLKLSLLFLFAVNQLQAAPHGPEKTAAGIPDHPFKITIPVTASADNQGVLTCAITSLTLYANTTATGATFRWTSTNGFESDLQNPTITVTGTYTVKVTNSTGSGKASITVTEYKTCPNVTAFGSSLSCLPQATLYASSTVPNAQYSWVGPYYFTSTLQRPTVVDPGTYTIKVTDPSNGCSTSKTVEVASATSSTIWAANFTVPNGTIRIDTGRYKWTATHTGASTTKFSPINYEFRAGNMGAGNTGTWTSQEISIAGKANVGVAVHVRSYAKSGGVFESDTTAIGDYLRLYYKLDGGPEVLFAEKIGAINNNYENYTTVSTRSLSGSTIQIIIRARATEADEYYFFDNVTVTGASGINVQAGISGNNMITCTNSSVTLNGTSSAPGSTYNWYGPNGYSSSEQNPTVNVTGAYTLLVTEPTKGCTDTANVTVSMNTAAPVEISINNSGTITCLTSSVSITGSSTTTGVNYSWTGPYGFNASTPSTTVTRGGTYTLTATNPVNGCFTSKSTTVVENTAAPAVTISNNSPISCGTPIVTLSAITTTPNASFLWLGPEDLVDVAGTTSTSFPGIYIITVTDPANGCITTDFTEVTEDYADCAARKVTTTANVNTAEQTQMVTGVNSFTYKAYPNPVIGNGVIEFASPQNTNATVSIYNVLGTCEKVLFTGTITAGRLNRVAVPATQFPAGTYYYIINVNGKVYSGKLIIVK